MLDTFIIVFACSALLCKCRPSFQTTLGLCDLFVIVKSHCIFSHSNSIENARFIQMGIFHHRPPTSSKNHQDIFLFQSFKYLFDHFSCRDNSCLRLLAWARCAFGNVSSKSDLYFISMPVCFKGLNHKCQSSLLLFMSNITFHSWFGIRCVCSPH